MEKLTLTCGRFLPRAGESEAERLTRMETYLTRLSEELGYLLAETERALAGVSATLSAVAAAQSRESE